MNVAARILALLGWAWGWVKRGLVALWEFVKTQQAANVVQIAVLIFVALTYWRYFLPEQQLKQTQDAQVKLDKDIGEKTKQIVEKDASIKNMDSVIRDREAKLAVFQQSLLKAEAEVNAAKAERDTALKARDQALAERDSARAEIAQLRVELIAGKKETKIQLAKLQDDVNAARVDAAQSIAKAEREKASASSSVVRFRQTLRPRILQTLPNYLAATCAHALDIKPSFVPCATRMMDGPTFGEDISIRDVESIKRELRELEKSLQEQWLRRHEEVARLNKQDQEYCRGMEADKIKACNSDAAEKVYQRNHSVTDHYNKSSFVEEKLRPLAAKVIANPSCPVLIDTEPLPSNWPRDCF